MLLEPLPIINRRLLDHYGKFGDGRATWRVIFSDDQIEKRLMTHTREGLELQNPEVMEVPKYSYIKAKYVLERLIEVPEFVNSQLIEKSSYEPIWTFEDKDGNPLPPKWEACVLIIKTVYDAANRAYQGAMYKPDEIDQGTPEAQMERVRLLEEELFGNETKVGDALNHDSGVGYGVRKRNDEKFLKN